mgnify:CR=1 FL=1
MDRGYHARPTLAPARRLVVRVRDVMTPTVLEVTINDSAVSVVAKLLALKVHRLFVVDATGTLVGVISTLDVLRHLQRIE